MSLKGIRTYIRKNITAILTIISISLLFTGFRLTDVQDWYNYMFVKTPIAVIESYDEPEQWNFNMPLNVAKEYYVVQKINIVKKQISYRDNLKFTIEIENKGKNTITTPRLVIFIINGIYQMWVGWDYNINEVDMKKGIILEYILPDEGQKTLGTWRVFSLIYDDSNLKLVSYNTVDFYVIEEESNFNFYIAFIAAVVPTLIFLFSTYRKRLTVQFNDLIKEEDDIGRFDSIKEEKYIVEKDLDSLLQQGIEPDVILMRLSIDIETTLRRIAHLSDISEINVSMGMLERRLIKKDIITDDWLKNSMKLFRRYRNELIHEGKTTDLEVANELGVLILASLKRIEDQVK